MSPHRLALVLAAVVTMSLTMWSPSTAAPATGQLRPGGSLSPARTVKVVVSATRDHRRAVVRRYTEPEVRPWVKDGVRRYFADPSTNHHPHWRARCSAPQDDPDDDLGIYVSCTYGPFFVTLVPNATGSRWLVQGFILGD